MMRQHKTDDELTPLLRGEVPAGDPAGFDLARLVLELRVSADQPAQPNAALADLLQPDGVWDLSADKGDLPVTAASNVPGPVSQVSGLPKWRPKMLTGMAGLGLAAKIALGSGVALASVGGVGVAGGLPSPAQDVFNRGVQAATPFDESTESHDLSDDMDSSRDLSTEHLSTEQDADDGSEEAAADAAEEARDAAADAAEEARDAAADAAEEAREEAEDAAEQEEDAAEEAREQEEEAAEQAEDAAEEAREQAEDAAEEAREQAEDAAADQQDAAEDAAEDADSDD